MDLTYIICWKYSSQMESKHVEIFFYLVVFILSVSLYCLIFILIFNFSTTSWIIHSFCLYFNYLCYLYFHIFSHLINFIETCKRENILIEQWCKLLSFLMSAPIGKYICRLRFRSQIKIITSYCQFILLRLKISICSS